MYVSLCIYLYLRIRYIGQGKFEQLRHGILGIINFNSVPDLSIV